MPKHTNSLKIQKYQFILSGIINHFSSSWLVLMTQAHHSSPIAPLSFNKQIHVFFTPQLALTRDNLMSYSVPDDGSKELGAVLSLGWIENRLFIQALVKDCDIENTQPLDEMWRQDCLELFISFPFCKNQSAANPCHFVVSAPNVKNICRICAMNNPLINGITATGYRTIDGYAVTIGLELDILSNGDFNHDTPFAIQLLIDDWDHSDGSPKSNPQPRILSLRKGQLLENSPILFHLAQAEELTEPYNLDAWWSISERPIICNEHLLITTNCPLKHDAMQIILSDPDGNILSNVNVKVNETLPPLKGLVEEGKLSLELRPMLKGQCLGFIKLPVYHLKTIPDKLAQLNWSEMAKDNAVKTAGYLALLSTLESLKFAIVRGRPNAEMIFKEAEYRLALLEGRDLPSDVPDKYSLLNLLHGWEAQIAVEYDNSLKHFGAEQVFVGIPWGNIPMIQASILFFPAEQEAARYLEWRMSFTIPGEIPVFDHADQSMTGKGHLFGDGMPWDRDFARLLSLQSPLYPDFHVMLPWEEAKKLKISSFSRTSDAPEEMPDLPITTKSPDGLAAFAGSPTQEPSKLFFSENGVETDILMVRQGNMVLQTAWTLPELDHAFAQLILSRSKLTRKQAFHFRNLLAEKLGISDNTQSSASFLIGDPHTHSLYSDGWISPAGMLANATAAGLDFLFFTDHNRMETKFYIDEVMSKSNCGLKYGTGLEISNSWRYHLNVLPANTPLNLEVPYHEILRQCKSRGAMLQLNHPMKYGNALHEHWYGDISKSGLDAVERDISQCNNWRKHGCSMPITGSTDTHTACFFQREKTLVGLSEFSENSFVEAISQGKCAMIAPDLRDFIFGEDGYIRQILPTMLSPEAPEQFAIRLGRMLEGFHADTLLELSSVISSLHPWYSLIRRDMLIPETIQQKDIDDVLSAPGD